MHPRTAAAALLLLTLYIAPADAHAQPRTAPSIRQQQAEEYGRIHLEREEQWDSLRAARSPRMPSMSTSLMPRTMARGAARSAAADSCRLAGRTVFGWHPYWSGTAYRDYNYELLSDICFFSYEVDPTTGSYTDIHGWNTTDLVPTAKKAGARVHLCVTLFSNHAALLASPANRARLVDSLTSLVKARDGDGVNIDFEAVPASQRENLTTFMSELATGFRAQIPGGRISIALPAVDWSNAFDVVAMQSSVDLFIIMGYDYHWSSAPKAGPVAPKNSGQIWEALDVTRSVNTYLAKGIPPAKLCLGVPYYGYEWTTADSTLNAATRGTGSSVLFRTARVRAAEHGRRWEPQSSTPYYIYRVDSAWKQCWYDDAESLRRKYDMVKMKELAGIGIWALGYDGAETDLWDVLRDAFSTCAASPCSSEFTDMGGPAGDYYNSERFMYTIAPRDAGTVTLAFYSFNVADDELAAYDGRDTTGTLLGRFTGTTSPGTLTARSGALTIAFRSNAATTSWGWVANWSCTTAPLAAPSRPRATLPASPAVTGLAAYPNPTSGSTTIVYHLARRARVRLSVTDTRGREVLLLHDRTEDAGHHTAVLDARGNKLPAGTYMVRAAAAGTNAVVKVTVR